MKLTLVKVRAQTRNGVETLYCEVPTETYEAAVQEKKRYGDLNTWVFAVQRRHADRFWELYDTICVRLGVSRLLDDEIQRVYGMEANFIRAKIKP